MNKKGSKHTFSRAHLIFEFSDNVEALGKLNTMKGQAQIVLRILRERNGPWSTNLLANTIAVQPDFKGKTPPERIANWYMFQLRNAGVLTFYESLRDYETIVALRKSVPAESEDIYPS